MMTDVKHRIPKSSTQNNVASSTASNNKPIYTPVLSEHLLEIRYSPNPKILDYRGTWAELISKYMELPEWQITQDRIDVFDTEQLKRVFVGFRSAGFLIRNNPTVNYFPEQSRKLFRFLFESLTGFGNKLTVERIGVRTKTLTLYDKKFDDLVKKLSTNYVNLSPTAENLLGAQLVDIGAPLNFEDKFGKFNTMSGPMNTVQASNYFSFAEEEELPKVGLYIDIDYYDVPQRVIDSQAILKLMRDFTNQGQLRYQQIASIILGS